MILHAEDITKSFRSRRLAAPVHAVQNASLTAEPGAFTAIVGESGSGKSTLARILLNLIAPTDGTVSLDGTPLGTMSRAERVHFRRNVQAVLQDPAGSLNPRKKVERTIGEVIRLHNRTATAASTRRKILDVLEQVGMTPPDRFLERYPHELSGGQRQRVLIARALALDPQIIIADEAVSALDASVKAGVLAVMADLQHRLGVGYVFITHDLPVVQKVADYVHVMHAGHIVEHGPKDTIFTAAQHPYTQTLLQAAPTF